MDILQRSMIKNFLNITAVLDIISKYSIYVLALLLPVFFLPWTFNILDFNKQALLAVLVFVSLFAWMINVLISGKIKFNLTGFYIPLGIFVLIVLASTIFSLWNYGSFWGWPLATNESFFTILCFALMAVLMINVLEKSNLIMSFYLFTISWFLVLIYGILQIFGKFIFRFDFAKTISFNTVGTIFSVSILTAVIMPLIIFLLINSKRAWKIFFTVYLVVSAFFLLLINFSVAWWVLMLSSALIIIFGTMKKDSFDTRWLTLPMFFLAISLLFSLFKFQVSGLPNVAPEVYLNQKTSFEIIKGALKENPVLGSGPGTFVYDFSKFRNPALNLSNFWEIRFENGNSKVSNILATTGVLGGLSFLLMIAFFVFYGIKFLFKKEKVKGASAENILLQDGLSIGLFSGIIAIVFGYFFYSSNLTLDFVLFFFAAGFIALNFGERREIVLKPSSFATLGTTFSFTLAFILGLGLFILEGQRYFAEASYMSGVRKMQAQKLDATIKNMEKAVVLNSRSEGIDLYLRQLSQVYLRKIGEVTSSGASQEEISKNVQILITSAINSAKMATDLNPKNVANWENLGVIYQNMIGVISDPDDWVIKTYDEAIKLDPSNPYLVLQKGAALLRKAELVVKEKADEKNKILINAQNQFEKSISLKSDYFLPHLYMSVLYQMKDKKTEAIREMEEASRLSGGNTGVIFQLGLLYYRDQDYNNAEKAFVVATTVDPNFANALYFLGLTYEEKGQRTKALEKFRKVLELNHSNEEIKKIVSNLESGKRALEGISEPEQSVVPKEEEPSEKLPVPPIPKETKKK